MDDFEPKPERLKMLDLIPRDLAPQHKPMPQEVTDDLEQAMTATMGIALPKPDPGDA